MNNSDFLTVRRIKNIEGDFLLFSDVYRIPDYRGGIAFIAASPDGVYLGMNLYVPDHAKSNPWTNLALMFSGYSPNSVVGIADPNKRRILAYVHIDRGDYSMGRGGTWVCVDHAKGPCVEYTSSFFSAQTNLPPSLWKRLVAWGAHELRGLGELDFNEIHNRESQVLPPGWFERQVP